MYNVAVIGAAGYVGAELVRVLLAHPDFKLAAISSNSEAGKTLAQVYPYFTERADLTFVDHETALAETDTKLDLVFLPVPHTAAMDLVPAILEKGISVVDVSADFRLHDAASYEAWYGTPHTAPDLLAKAVYGLPEAFRSELKVLAAKRASQQEPALVAAPGCYPTASTLAALPVLKAGLFNSNDVVVINAISGISGAGKIPTDTTHFCSVNENVNAYGVAFHRHTPEIAQTFSHLAERNVAVQFTPHIAPLSRGMVSTVTLRLSKKAAAEATPENIQKLYEDQYAEEAFVHVMPPGTMPRSSSVIYSNYAHVGVAYDASTNMVVASCTIDNLAKGAAAQSVQCANIIFNLNETTGLKK
ncbi:MAG: N-acetyl-gamma-glutamyl-phosphate reductase [Coriobacteriia bacterium]|nr:N-acetyl-gamma-glutamyl-phosphate reductase [Coriobacteriia bacterium]MCL2750224.1 N-acetyl-gamma-glutamyl-phosphate reductase [Coriobacteriia bacterium]